MKTVDLSFGSSSASLEAKEDRKRQISPTTEDDVTLSSIDAELTRNIGLQKKKLAKLNLELQQLSEDIADQSPYTSRDISTNEPTDIFLYRPVVHRSQPIDIQYSVAAWRTMEHTSAAKIMYLYDDVVEESPAAIEPYGHQVGDAVSQDRSIDPSTVTENWPMTETKDDPGNPVQHEVQQGVASAENKELKAQKVSEPSATVYLQFKTLRRLFVYAHAVSAVDLVKRPAVQLSLTNLCTLTEALCNGHLYQSDATSMIASSLSILMNSISEEAEGRNAAEYGETVEMVINLNKMLKECYNWDPDKARFLGPLDVQDFNDVLTYFTLLANVDISETYIRQYRLDEHTICANLGIEAEGKLNLEQKLLATFNARRLERSISATDFSRTEGGRVIGDAVREEYGPTKLLR
jgi:hypothetical protein